MSEYIKGKEAIMALMNGRDVEYKGYDDVWRDTTTCLKIYEFNNGSYVFRLKPQTIEVTLTLPKPFIPKIGETYYRIFTGRASGYACNVHEDSDFGERCLKFGAYRTEEDIKQVVKALEVIKTYAE